LIEWKTSHVKNWRQSHGWINDNDADTPTLQVDPSAIVKARNDGIE